MQLRREPRERLLVDAPGLGDAGPGTPDELLARPLGPRDADHHHVQTPAPRQGVERREDLLVGEITGRAEEHERIRQPVLLFTISHLGPRLGQQTTGFSGEPRLRPSRPEWAPASPGAGRSSRIWAD